jgi:hypothetical protein
MEAVTELNDTVGGTDSPVTQLDDVDLMNGTSDHTTAENVQETDQGQTDSTEQPGKTSDQSNEPSESRQNSETVLKWDDDEEAAAQVSAPTALAALLQATPALKQLIDANPQLKGQIEHAWRQSDVAGQYREVFPSIDDAKTAKALVTLFPAQAGRAPTDVAKDALAARQTLSELESLFHSGNRADTEKLLERMHQMQFEYDDDGSLLLDPRTMRPSTNGAYDRLVGVLNEAFLDSLEQQFATDRNGAVVNQPIADAVRVIREALGQPKGGRGEGGGGGSAELPAEVQARLRKLNEYERRESEASQQQTRAFREAATAAITERLGSYIDKALSALPYPEFAKAAIRQEALEEIYVRAGESREYRAAMEAVARNAPPDDNTKQQLVRQAFNWARPQVKALVEAKAKKVGEELAATQADKTEKRKQAEQRREPTGTGAAGTTRQMSEVDKVKALEKRMGRRLTDREILEL